MSGARAASIAFGGSGSSSDERGGIPAQLPCVKPEYLAG